MSGLSVPMGCPSCWPWARTRCTPASHKVDFGTGMIREEGRAVEKDGTKFSGGDGVLFLTGGAEQAFVRPSIGVEFVVFVA